MEDEPRKERIRQPIDPKDAERVLRNLTNTTLNDMRASLRNDLQVFAAGVASQPTQIVEPPPISINEKFTDQSVKERGGSAPAERGAAMEPLNFFEGHITVNGQIASATIYGSYSIIQE